jgi:hypothetical protein
MNSLYALFLSIFFINIVYNVYAIMFVCFAVLGFDLRAYTLSILPLFCDGFFQNRVLQTICQGWLQTLIPPISAS